MAVYFKFLSFSGLQVPTIQPAVDTSKSVRTPAMIQPKIPVPLNLPRLHPAPQPAHGFQPSNAISPGNPMSAQMVPGTSNLPSVSLTQIPTPQFFSTPCNMMRSPVSPQFLTPQPQLSPMVPVSPTMFQVCFYNVSMGIARGIKCYAEFYRATHP